MGLVTYLMSSAFLHTCCFSAPSSKWRLSDAEVGSSPLRSHTHAALVQVLLQFHVFVCWVGRGRLVMSLAVRFHMDIASV